MEFKLVPNFLHVVAYGIIIKLVCGKSFMHYLIPRHCITSHFIYRVILFNECEIYGHKVSQEVSIVSRFPHENFMHRHFIDAGTFPNIFRMQIVIELIAFIVVIKFYQSKIVLGLTVQFIDYVYNCHTSVSANEMCSKNISNNI